MTCNLGLLKTRRGDTSQQASAISNFVDDGPRPVSVGVAVACYLLSPFLSLLLVSLLLLLSFAAMIVVVAIVFVRVVSVPIVGVRI